MVQIPTSFTVANACIVTATSSGSRGVYGAIGTRAANGAVSSTPTRAAASASTTSPPTRSTCRTAFAPTRVPPAPLRISRPCPRPTRRRSTRASRTASPSSTRIRSRTRSATGACRRCRPCSSRSGRSTTSTARRRPTARRGRRQPRQHDRHRLVGVQRRRRRARGRGSGHRRLDRRRGRVRAQHRAAGELQPQGRPRRDDDGGRGPPAVRLLHARQPAAALRRAVVARGDGAGRRAGVRGAGDQPLHVAEEQGPADGLRNGRAG